MKDEQADLSYTREITEKDIEAHLMTSKVGSPSLDILIRTSGVRRLSDYLLWQVRLHTSFISTWDLASAACDNNPTFDLRLADTFDITTSAAKTHKYILPTHTGPTLACGTLSR